MTQFKRSRAQDGNAAVIALIVVVLVAVLALGYYVQMKDDTDVDSTTVIAETQGEPDTSSEQMADNNEMPADTETETETATDQTQDTDVADNQAAADNSVKPGNPVVAEVNDADITRMEVFNYMQTLPAQARQLPAEQLFPVALEQVINATIIKQKTQDVNLEDDPAVKQQLQTARENIMRAVYVERMVDKRLTEKRLQDAYEQYKAAFPKVQEVNARHILVKEETKAQDMITELEGGADFSQLAKENSIDGTAESGGKVGWFAKGDVVPEFGEAAFNTAEGTYTKTPVKSDFGYHVIMVDAKRQRPVPEYEQAKPFLEAQLRRSILEEIMQEWRAESDIERFNINGQAIEPAAGDE